MRTYTLGEFARLTGKATSTLQRWDRTGVLAAHRTVTNRRYYTHDQYLSVMGLPPEPETTRGKRTVIYTRVSSRGRRGDLDNSDGTVFDNADTSGRIRKLERRKRRLERSLARSRRANQGKDKEHGWHNYRKILLRKRCVEQRLANIRTERMRRVCDELARRQPSSLTIEHLNVKGMMKTVTSRPPCTSRLWRRSLSWSNTPATGTTSNCDKWTAGIRPAVSATNADGRTLV